MAYTGNFLSVEVDLDVVRYGRARSKRGVQKTVASWLDGARHRAAVHRDLEVALSSVHRVHYTTHTHTAISKFVTELN